MLSFEERKKLHEENLLEHIEIVEKMEPKIDATELSKKEYKIMLLPQTENELEYAEAVLALYIEIDELTALAAAGKTKLVPLEENKFCDYFIDKLKEAKDDTYIFDEKKYKDMSIEESAQFIYEAAIYQGYTEEIVPYLFERMGFDSGNILHLMQFMSLLATIKFDIPKPGNTNDSDIEKVMEEGKKLYKAFHQLCEKNRIISKEDSNSYTM